MIKIAAPALLLSVLLLPLAQARLFYLPLPNLRPASPPLLSTKNIPPTPAPVNPQSKTTELDKQKEDSSSSENDETKRKRDLIDWTSLLNLRTEGARSPYVQANDEDEDALLPESLNQWNQNDPNKYLHRVSRKPVTVTPTTKSATLNENDVDNNEPWLRDNKTSRYERLLANGAVPQKRNRRRNDTIFLIVVGISSLVGIIGLLSAAVFWYKIQKRAELAAEAEYPSYGVTGPQTKMSPSSSSMSDRKLAQSAQMYHYQQQRQAMIQQEKSHMDAKPVQSDESDDEGTGPGGGDYTVFECPGLAPTGEMEVRNPLFTELDTSLASPAPSTVHPTTNNHYPQLASSGSPPKDKSLQ